VDYVRSDPKQMASLAGNVQGVVVHIKAYTLVIPVSITKRTNYNKMNRLKINVYLQLIWSDLKRNGHNLGLNFNFPFLMSTHIKTLQIVQNIEKKKIVSYNYMYQVYLVFVLWFGVL
jgi:hypothetical protein